MDLDRLNPVTLIAGVASGAGAAAARALALPSQGGLILADRDEAALSAAADVLDELRLTPERVSTLAFDPADPERWAQAVEFVRSQYGHIDYAVIASAGVEGAGAAPGELVDWGRRPEDLPATETAVAGVAPLIRANYQGGAMIVAASAGSINLRAKDSGLLGLVRTAADAGAVDGIRVNGVATDGARAPFWNELPWFSDIAGGASDEAALERIAGGNVPLARYAGADDTARLFRMLLTRGNGATLVVDGGYTI